MNCMIEYKFERCKMNEQTNQTINCKLTNCMIPLKIKDYIEFKIECNIKIE